MHHGTRRQPTRAVGWRTLLIAAVSAAALIVPGVAAGTASAETTWLCRPGIANNPCLSSEETTVVLANGKSFVENPQPAKNPPIDCFYVYPTVSSQSTTNANEEIGPEETQIAISQASRFSQVCKVYAPIYRQITITALNTPHAVTPIASLTAYITALKGFQEYLAKYNEGRPFVLIGHSQGTAILNQLVKEQIDPNEELRSKMVSATLLGGNIIVPSGKTVGGSFKNIPTCQTVVQTGCVTAYSSFLQEPPNPSNFGRPESALGFSATEAENPQVACVNPTLGIQAKLAGPTLAYYPTQPFPGLLGPFVQVPSAPTPWVAAPAQYSAQCKNTNGASWLQLSLVNSNDQREQLKETLGPLWGTHLDDVNVAMGNLVAEVGLRAVSYQIHHITLPMFEKKPPTPNE
jgi:Protein of unknown function (DUF3089)